MNNQYHKDREWSDKYIENIKQIVGPFLLSEAPFEQDANESTDLIVLHQENKTIACRIRKNGYFEKYGNEFTIRLSRPSGAKTELEKIKEGFVDIYFYGHVNEKGDIHKWMILDMDAFRHHIKKNVHLLSWKVKENVFTDKTKFVSIDVTSFPDEPSIVLKSNFL